jgi:hypothetical protein
MEVTPIKLSKFISSPKILNANQMLNSLTLSFSYRASFIQQKAIMKIYIAMVKAIFQVS